MKKWICVAAVVALFVLVFFTWTWARGTRYVVTWPQDYIGPVYVQVYDIRCNPPYELTDRFVVYVTWEGKTKTYVVAQEGTHLIKMWKKKYHPGPMIISGTASSFRIRYGMVPPWI